MITFRKKIVTPLAVVTVVVVPLKMKMIKRQTRERK